MHLEASGRKLVVSGRVWRLRKPSVASETNLWKHMESIRPLWRQLGDIWSQSSRHLGSTWGILDAHGTYPPGKHMRSNWQAPGKPTESTCEAYENIWPIWRQLEAFGVILKASGMVLKHVGHTWNLSGKNLRDTRETSGRMALPWDVRGRLGDKQLQSHTVTSNRFVQTHQAQKMNRAAQNQVQCQGGCSRNFHQHATWLPCTRKHPKETACAHVFHPSYIWYLCSYDASSILNGAGTVMVRTRWIDEGMSVIQFTIHVRLSTSPNTHVFDTFASSWAETKDSTKGCVALRRKPQAVLVRQEIRIKARRREIKQKC